MKAYVTLRTDPHYRMEAFCEGLRRCGYTVVAEQPVRPLDADDVLVVWNLLSRGRAAAELARPARAAVLVAENGYYGADAQGRQTYALALDAHCGAGRWFVGGYERLDALDIPFRPLQTGGASGSGRVLVADQRGIGSPKMASPAGFGERTAALLRGRGYEVEVRPHPGKDKQPAPLQAALDAAEAVVVWSSNVATHALVAGKPTYYCAPSIVTQGAALRFPAGFGCFEDRITEHDRREAFRRLSWAQWFVDEIAGGEAFKTLIDHHKGAL